jgi:glycosyltransferase involved in cell wall biosynthesis
MVVMNPNSGRNVAIVAIGRNEGERLKSCLESTVEPGRIVVYVDSGSNDKSVEYASQWAAMWLNWM